MRVSILLSQRMVCGYETSRCCYAMIKNISVGSAIGIRQKPMDFPLDKQDAENRDAPLAPIV